MGQRGKQLIQYEVKLSDQSWRSDQVSNQGEALTHRAATITVNESQLPRVMLTNKRAARYPTPLSAEL